MRRPLLRARRQEGLPPEPQWRTGRAPRRAAGRQGLRRGCAPAAVAAAHVAGTATTLFVVTAAAATAFVTSTVAAVAAVAAAVAAVVAIDATAVAPNATLLLLERRQPGSYSAWRRRRTRLRQKWRQRWRPWRRRRRRQWQRRWRQLHSHLAPSRSAARGQRSLPREEGLCVFGHHPRGASLHL